MCEKCGCAECAGCEKKEEKKEEEKKKKYYAKKPEKA